MKTGRNQLNKLCVSVLTFTNSETVLHI